jgi:hypothetical protein
MTAVTQNGGRGPFAALTHPQFAAALLLAALAGLVAVDMRTVPALGSESGAATLSGGRAALAPGGGPRPAAGNHHQATKTAASASPSGSNKMIARPTRAGTSSAADTGPTHGRNVIDEGASVSRSQTPAGPPAANGAGQPVAGPTTGAVEPTDSTPTSVPRPPRPGQTSTAAGQGTASTPVPRPPRPGPTSTTAGQGTASTGTVGSTASSGTSGSAPSGSSAATAPTQPSSASNSTGATTGGQPASGSQSGITSQPAPKPAPKPQPAPVPKPAPAPKPR